MLSFCIGVYLILILSFAVLLWAALVAAKEGDRKIIDHDIEVKGYSSTPDSLHIAEFN